MPLCCVWRFSLSKYCSSVQSYPTVGIHFYSNNLYSKRRSIKNSTKGPKRHLPPRNHLPPRHQIHYLLISHTPPLFLSQLRSNIPRFLLDCLCMATTQHALQCVAQFVTLHGGCILAIAPDAYAEVFNAVSEVV